MIKAFIQIQAAHILIAAGGMEDLKETGKSILKWVQGFGLVAAAIAFSIGAYFLILGGDRGRGRSVGWFIGAAAGLVILMGAYSIATGIDDNIKFGN